MASWQRGELRSAGEVLEPLERARGPFLALYARRRRGELRDALNGFLMVEAGIRARMGLRVDELKEEYAGAVLSSA